jgi:hypothetical protein
MRPQTALIAVVLTLIAVAAWADHRGVFGVREEQVPDFMHLTFRFVDAESRAPVSGVHFACTRPMQRSACTEREGPRAGQTTITFGAMKRTTRTLFFSKDNGHVLGGGGVMTLTFIHPNYEISAMELDDNALTSPAGRMPVIELTRTAE